MKSNTQQSSSCKWSDLEHHRLTVATLLAYTEIIKGSYPNNKIANMVAKYMGGRSKKAIIHELGRVNKHLGRLKRNEPTEFIAGEKLMYKSVIARDQAKLAKQAAKDAAKK